MAELFSTGESSSEEGWDTEDSWGGEEGRLRARGDGVTPRNSSLISSSGLSAMSGPPCGTLRLDKTHAMVGDLVGVYWDIPSVQTSASDWIAVYERGEEDIEQYLDYRLRGESQDRHGHVTWNLDHNLFEASEQTDIFFAIFQANNSCLARSSMLTVTNRNFSTSSQVLLAPQSTEPCTIRIEGIFCSNLRTKLFGKPDPFLKMGVVPGPRLLRAACHAQRVVTDPCFGSVHPQWIQSYEFGVVSTDVLEIDVRDKFVASRPSFTHFLGRARIPASQLLRRSSVTLTLPLQKRLPSDRVTGTLTFTVTQPTIMAEEREEREGGRRGGRRGGEDERREEGGEQREEAEQATSNETESSAVTESSIQNLPGPTATHEPPLSLAGAEQLELAGATPLTAAANDSLPLSRQLSHDPQTNSRLNQIRSQLCGRGLQRGSQSLYTRSPAHQRRLQFTVSLSPSPSLPPPPPFLTARSEPAPHFNESLPPNFEVSVEDISHFVRRSDRNILCRQPSDPFILSDHPTPNLVLRRSNTTPSRSSQYEDPSSSILPVNSSATMVNVLNRAHQLSSIEEKEGREVVVTTEGGEEAGGKEKQETENEEQTPKEEREDRGEREEGEKNDGEESTGGGGPLTRISSVDPESRDFPAFKFLTRPDLYQFAKEEQNEVLFGDTAILELVQTIRSDHSQFPRYQHNSKLVALLNSFARTECELPAGWERRKDTRSGRVVFVDHHTQRTTYIDPRLPYPGNNLSISSTSVRGVASRSRPYASPDHQPQPRRRRSRDPAAPYPSPAPSSPPPIPPRPPHTLIDTDSPPSTSQSYSERVVAFMSQPGVMDEIRTRYSEPITNELRSALESIRTNGVAEMVRLQNEEETLFLDIMIIISLFDEEISHNIFPVASSPPPPHLLPSSLPPPPPLLPSSLPPPSPPPPPPPLLPSSLSPPPPPPPLPPSSLPPPSPPPPLPHSPLPPSLAASIANLVRTPHSPPSPPPPPPLPFQNPPTRRHWSLETPPTTQATPTHTAQTQTIDREAHTFASVPIQRIMEYMRSNDAYRFCLNEFRTFSSNQRLFFATFDSGSSVSSVEEALADSSDLRNFTRRMLPGVLGERHSTPVILPSAREVGRFFSRPDLDSFLESLSPEDRAVAAEIRSSNQIAARMIWDTTWSGLIRRYSDEIRSYRSPNQGTNFPLGLDYSPPSSPSSPSSSLGSSPRLSSSVPLPPAVAGARGRAFIEKLQALQRNLERNGYASSDHRKLEVSMRREHLLEDAFLFIMGTKANRLRRKKCNITWDTEEGLDYGGPQREFFFKISRLLFNPFYGLFEYSAQGSYTLQICPQSIHIADALKWFRFAGRLVGYAIIQGNLLDVFFARHVYKSLLGRAYTVHDIEALDLSFHNSLKFVLENDPSPLELNFTVLEVNFGEMKEKELKVKGGQVSVTEGNKTEYVDLMVQWRLGRGIHEQTKSFRKGLLEMVPMEYLSEFDSQELEWVIAGTAEIDMDDWKNNTSYWGGYHANSQVIRWFWEVVEEFTNEQKLKLLQFVTGTSSIPFEGFRALRGSSTVQQFTIDMLDLPGQRAPLPIAHTCFNRLDLPAYQTNKDLRNKLTLAIEECETFENA